MNKKYKSTALAALHESMQDLREIGIIDQKTMRRFNESCLTPITSIKRQLS